MALVTMELRQCLKINSFQLFDFDYQISDTNWKEELEGAIIDFYYFHEIGQETLERFKQRFASRMKLIMPYYDELHQSKLLNIDPLLTQHLSESLSDQANVDTSMYSTSETVFTDYPEHASIVDDIPTNKGSGATQNSQTTGSSHNYEKIISGFSGASASSLLLEYRKTIMNLNQLIIDDLKQCFILVY